MAACDNTYIVVYDMAVCGHEYIVQVANAVAACDHTYIGQVVNDTAVYSHAHIVQVVNDMVDCGNIYNGQLNTMAACNRI